MAIGRILFVRQLLLGTSLPKKQLNFFDAKYNFSQVLQVISSNRTKSYGSKSRIEKVSL